MTASTKVVAAVLAVTAALVLTACGSDAGEPAPQLHHVHDLVEGDDGSVLIASHSGVYRLDERTDRRDARLEGPLGGLDIDAMALAPSADGRLIASGHPGATTPPEFGSPHLGLIEFDDEWITVAYAGEVDFHALAVDPTDPSVVVGVDTQGPRLRASPDGGRTWNSGIDLNVRDLTVHEADGGVLMYATTPGGLWTSSDRGQGWELDRAAPPIALVSAADGQVVGIDEQLRLWSRRSGGEWERIGSTPNQPVALLLGSDAIWLADDSGTIWKAPRGDDPVWTEAYS